MAREINLVPDIKNEMIHALKLRNLIFFLCIIVSAGIIVVVVLLGITKGTQDLVIANREETITAMSNKINSYSDLSHFLTIRDQVSDLNTISENKTVLSRVFYILPAILPTGADTITISELNVNLSTDSPTISFEAQADAGSEPYIDYNVLDSFKKSMPYIHYDYGSYVDAEDNQIPAYCMIETDSDGSILKDEESNIYAYWQIETSGCKSEDSTATYTVEEYDGQNVVRIWRTPRFAEWVASENMTTSGEISGVAHFESQCITYKNVRTSDGSDKWSEDFSSSCSLVPDGVAGISISESSNGRSSDNNLVLRFAATITLNPEYFNFNNTHMLAFGPSGRYNVTDSYSQIQGMFSERAADCSKTDTACKGGN